ncbi:MAG: tetratricopeptide repeat protein, partial [Candidatus Heimdallarchaeaceae archaeon]
MLNSDFDTPAEFSIFQQFFEKNKETFIPLVNQYKKAGYTFFQSIVHACEHRGRELPAPDKSKSIFLDAALIGYFLLGEYEKVLDIPVHSDTFLSAYFRFKSAWLLGDKSAQSLLSNLIPSLMELKQTNKEAYEICNNILALEISFINANRTNILKHAKQFRKDLFENVLVNQFPLLAIQLAGDLAYREYRTGDPEFSGWLEIYKELTEAFNMDTKRLDCYTILGGLYRYKGYLEEAAEYYKRAMELSEKIGNMTAYAELIAKIADFEHTRGNFDKALELCMDIIENPKFEGKVNTSIYINLGEILIKQQQYAKAIE